MRIDSLEQAGHQPQLISCGDRTLDLSVPQVMGILNVTPDSFSDGGQFTVSERIDIDRVCLRVEQMLSEGAAIIDVGGESTRPGAKSVSLSEEQDRVLPVVEAIGRRFDTIISVDTSRPEIMRDAAILGAGMLNDVRALSREGALEAAAASQLPVCLMHMQGTPETMQQGPDYARLIDDVLIFLQSRIDACVAAGIGKERLLVDPGFGFGKTVQHNLQLLGQLAQFKRLGCPVLAGLSRKSMLGSLLGREVDQRLAGSVALAMIAVTHGAGIVRVHDVAETVDALKVLTAVSVFDKHQ